MLGFGLLVVMNVMNVYYKILCEHIFFFFLIFPVPYSACVNIFSIFLDMFLDMELQNYMRTLCSTLFSVLGIEF